MTPEALEVVALAYETVGDMARWPELLHRTQALVGADATIQLVVDATPHVLRRADVLERGTPGYERPPPTTRPTKPTSSLA